jgi:hypothetical protein
VPTCKHVSAAMSRMRQHSFETANSQHYLRISLARDAELAATATKQLVETQDAAAAAEAGQAGDASDAVPTPSS